MPLLISPRRDRRREDLPEPIGPVTIVSVWVGRVRLGIERVKRLGVGLEGLSESSKEVYSSDLDLEVDSRVLGDWVVGFSSFVVDLFQ